MVLAVSHSRFWESSKLTLEVLPRLPEFVTVVGTAGLEILRVYKFYFGGVRKV